MEIMRLLCRCGNSISKARLDLKFTTCLECGEREAQKQKIEKQSRIVPAGHKMGLTYVSPDSITTHVKYLNKTTPVSIDSVTVEKRKTPKYKVVRKNHGYIRENGILRALIEVKKIPLGD
jgi:hypothetical protein